MGIPGWACLLTNFLGRSFNLSIFRIIREFGKGQRIALAKLAVEHLERTNRPLRIAIDAAIWSFQNQASQGGSNPALRVFYFRLVRLLALPIHPLFVYDGPNKPGVKRNRKVGVWNSQETRLSKKLLQLFHFPYLTAPGEAEAECANLQRRGIVDAVMSQDADAVMFGSTLTLKNWSAEGSRGNHAPTHVDVLRSSEILVNAGLDTPGMILIALLSGGDYDTVGVEGCGPTIACEIAKIKNPNFAADLLRIKARNDVAALNSWRDRLNHELKTNESKFFRRRHNITIPEWFPKDEILGFYTNPAITPREKLEEIEFKISAEWKQEDSLVLNLPSLREFTREYFEWKYINGGKKFMRNLAPSLLPHRLRLQQPMTDVLNIDSIVEKGERFEHDGIPLIRLQARPSQIVPIDLALEEERPADDATGEEVDGVTVADEAENLDGTIPSSQAEVPMTPSKKRKARPWDPDALEKYWLAESIFRRGMPRVSEDWDKRQKEMKEDPVKWATRKLKPKVKDANMKSGAMNAFFKPAKPGLALQPTKPSALATNSMIASSMTVHLSSAKPKPTTKRTVAGSPRKGVDIAAFFQPRSQTISSSLETIRASSFCGGETQPLSDLGKLGTDITNSIEIPSSPMEEWIPPQLSTSLFSEQSRQSPSTPFRSLPAGNTSLPTSPDSLPSPSGLLSSQDAFKTMSPINTTELQRRRKVNPGQAVSQVAKHGANSMPSSKPIETTVRTNFKISKAGRESAEVKKKKVSVVARDSLPGTWKEIECDEDDGIADEDLIAAADALAPEKSGTTSTAYLGMGQPGSRRRAQRVSLVDLT